VSQQCSNNNRTSSFRAAESQIFEERGHGAILSKSDDFSKKDDCAVFSISQTSKRRSAVQSPKE